MNLLSDRVQIPADASEVGVRTRIALEDGQVPQLVLDFRAAEEFLGTWPLPYLGNASDGPPVGSDEEDVLFIDFGTSATRVIDLAGDRPLRAAPVPAAQTEQPELTPSEPQSQPLSVRDPPPSSPPPSVAAFVHPRRAGFNGDEREFVAYLEDYCTKTGLVVQDGLIKNIYLCLKVRPLVVLAGPPGVGKSSVATRFAEAMGSSFDRGHDSLRIAVEANWTDGRYLFWQHYGAGAPEPSRFLQLLRRLESEPAERPHHVLFDEMNLAHVEYYFAQFLSALEADGSLTVPGARAEQAELRLPHRARPAELGFFGTINIDETTHVLSDKVLDRCNLIEVRMASIPSQFVESRPQTELCATVEQLRAWRQLPGGAAPVSDELRSIVTSLATETPPSDQAPSRTYGRGVHLGYRLVRDIALFCHYASRLDIDPQVALDWQVCQRILPRIRGDARLGHALRGLDAELARQGLQNSRHRLQRILRDLDDGFVSFWA